jgi:hypothetical protein
LADFDVVHGATLLSDFGEGDFQQQWRGKSGGASVRLSRRKIPFLESVDRAESAVPDVVLSMFMVSLLDPASERPA